MQKEQTLELLSEMAELLRARTDPHGKGKETTESQDFKRWMAIVIAGMATQNLSPLAYADLLRKIEKLRRPLNLNSIHM